MKAGFMEVRQSAEKYKNVRRRERHTQTYYIKYEC